VPIALFLFSAERIAQPQAAANQCGFRCPCSPNAGVYTYHAMCVDLCYVNPGCFVGICDFASTMPEGVDLPPFVRAEQDRNFPGMCYTGLWMPSSRERNFNCFAWALDMVTPEDLQGSEPLGPLTPEMLDGMGNRNGRHDWGDWEKILSETGFSRSSNCAPEPGKSKVALYGNRATDPAPRHAARSAHDPDDQAKGLFESKEGNSKLALHAPADIAGPKYGPLDGCWESG